MLRKVHDEDDIHCDWVQRPSCYGMSAPFFDFERIREFEERELTERLEAGAAYNRSRLPPEVLQRALTNDEWFEAPKRKEGKGKGGKKWNKGKKGKDWSKTEVTPKGQRKGEEDKPCPKGREPNPELMGGEGIEPYELYSHDLYSLERLMTAQACAWYMMADIRA